jgi:anthranilate phosphoribosyltransferase
VLEALGARIDLEAHAVARCIDKAGFGFMFAPLHHQATRFVVPVRRELAVRTVFNLLGPLTNPAGARRQLIGVSDRRFLEIVAGALSLLGAERALVVASEDQLDEISVVAPTHVIEVHGDELRRYVLDPADLGISDTGGRQTAANGVQGGTPEHNAAVTRAILEGGSGPAAAVALANAGAAIYVAGGADTIAEGVEAAREALARGRAAEALERYVRATLDGGAEREAPQP